MKKYFLINTFIIIGSGILALGSPEKVLMNDPNHQHDHFILPPIPADMPEVYYDSDVEDIIIYGSGYSINYNVEIYSQSSSQLVLDTTVNGTYDTIDVSSLSNDDYTIVIISSYNNEFEGQFCIER